MVKSKKKFYLIVVAIVAVLLVFAGCTKKSASSTSSKKVSSTSTQMSPQLQKWAKKASKYTAAHPYHITWYTIGTQQKDMPQVEAAMNKFLRKKIHAVVNIRMLSWGSYDKKMKVITLSGQPYDLAFTCSWTNNYLQNAQQGAYLSLNNLLKYYGKGITKALNPAFLQGPKINGQLYAIPTNKEVAQQIVYVMPAKFLKKYGFKISDFTPNKDLATLKSLEPYMAAIDKHSKKIDPMLWGAGEVFLLHNQAYIMGNSLLPGAVTIGKGYTVYNQWKNPEFIKQLKYIRYLYKKGYTSGSRGRKTSTQGMMKQSLGGITVSQYQPDADVLWTNEYGYKVVSIPKFKPIITNSSVMGAMIAISRTARNPVIDMKFLNLLNTNVYLRNLINYGIEGVQYTKTGPTTIKFIKKGHQNYKVPAFTLQNEFILYTIPGQPKNLWSKFKAWNATAIKSQIVGFHFNPTPVQTQITELSSIANQYGHQLFDGSAPVKATLQKFYTAMNSAGIKQVLAAEQSQLNAWVKHNAKLKAEGN